MKWAEVLEAVKHKEHKAVKGKVSCSSLPALAICGGKMKAEEGLLERPDIYTSTGSACHYVMEHLVLAPNQEQLQSIVGIPEDVSEKIAKVVRVVEHLINQGWTIVHKEFFMEGDWLTGSPDMIMTRGGDILLVDFKFGYQYIGDATLQMLGYSHLALAYKWNSHNGDIYTCVIQPDQDECRVVKVDLDEVTQKLRDVCRNIEKGERVPCEESCQFCKACGKSACPETHKAIAAIVEPEFTGEITAATLQKYATFLPMMKKAVKNFETELKAHLVDNEINGVKLKSGHKLYTVASVPRAYAQLKEHVSPQKFMAKCSVTLKQVEDLLYEEGLCKRKDARVRALEILGIAVGSNDTAAKLEYYHD